MGVDPKHADQQLRGAVTLPNGTGKTKRVLVFAKGEKIKGSLSSISWTTGSANLTKAKPVPIPPPALRNEVLPEGTEIEVEEESTQPEAGAFSSSPMPTQSTRPVPATTPREPSSDASPVYVPININDGTENLF